MTNSDHRKIHSRGKKNVTRSVIIRPDQKAWLKAHPAVNVSGLLQEAIDIYMKRDAAWRARAKESLDTASL